MRYNKIICDTEFNISITERAILLSLLLISYTNEKDNIYGIINFKSKRKLADKIGIQKDTFNRGIKELEDNNLIKIEKNKITLLNPEKYYYIEKKHYIKERLLDFLWS